MEDLNKHTRSRFGFSSTIYQHFLHDVFHSITSDSYSWFPFPVSETGSITKYKSYSFTSANNVNLSQSFPCRRCRADHEGYRSILN